MRDIEIRLGKLEAAEDIRHLKARYARICDTGYSPEAVRPLFTEDAVWESKKFGRHVGREAICSFFADVSKQIVWALHYMINPIVEVDDDLINAKGTWYLWQPCTLGTPEGPKPVWLTGLYADRYRKEGGSWRFSDVRLDIQTISPIAEGWVRRPFWDEG
jgi:hypothetical protein